MFSVSDSVLPVCIGAAERLCSDPCSHKQDVFTNRLIAISRNALSSAAAFSCRYPRPSTLLGVISYGLITVSNRLGNCSSSVQRLGKESMEFLINEVIG